MLRRLILLVCMLPAVSSRAQTSTGGFDATVGASVGNHIHWDLTTPSLFPFVELRTSYSPTRVFTARITMATGLTKLSDPFEKSFEGASLMVVHAGLDLLFSPRLTDAWHLNLGAGVGLWYAVLWGGEIQDAGTGSPEEFAESIEESLSLVAGVEWDVTKRWALLLEARASTIPTALAGHQYNAGGVTVLAGFVYRLKTSGP